MWSKPIEALKRCVAGLVLGTWAFSAASSSQTPQTTAKIDFSRDVLPIFRQNCFGCHGPSQQINGLRLDRRSSVFKNGLRRVVPGSSENSFLYHRLIGGEFGLQMPPASPLRPEQISVIKAWIDQGAEWPDALSNEADLPPLNPQAVALVEALRIGDRQSFMQFVEEDQKLLNARGPEGSTPFMYAVLYTDAATLEQLLKKGTDPNARNDANATALMWASSSSAFSEEVILKVKHSGKCAQVNGASQANGTKITQWDCLRQLNVHWNKVSIGDPYFLLYAAHTTVGKQAGKCAQVDGRSHANGANISQWDCLNQDNVKWSVRPAGDGYVFLVNKESGKCMQVDGGSMANGANISQWDCVNQDNLKWKMEPVPHGAIPFDNGSAGRPAKN